MSAFAVGQGVLGAAYSRRGFLRLGMVVSAAGVLAACGKGSTALPHGSNAASPAGAASVGASPAGSASVGGASPAGSLRLSSVPAAASGANASQAAASPAGLCVLTAEQTVGPYYLANQKIRKDVTEGKAGVPLRLRMTVLDSTKCAALPNAAVDIWHADAGGNYSGFSGGGRPGGNQANGQTFLRGTQLTDSSGLVEFDTIYPGWYPGRAIHIHLRVHVGGAAGATYNGGHVSHTGQLFFPENISDRVVKLAPYSSHGGVRTLQNQDSIFRSQHGGTSIPKMTPINSAYVAEMTLAVDPNAARSETQ